jgi:hypothetical protein
MKKVLFLGAMAIVIASCTSSERGESIKYVSPKGLGCTKLETKITPFPGCNGGECALITYVIGVKLSGEIKSREIPIYAEAFSAQKGVVNGMPQILAAQELHKTILSASLSEIVITLENDQIVEMVKTEHWDGKSFSPQVLLWKKK